MQNLFKKIGFFIISISLTLFIFWLVFLDKEAKNDVLDYSVKLLGERLLAMIPDSLGKESVASLYNNFSRKVSKREIPPEKVELVAANIMNMSNLDTVLTPSAAAAILEYSTREKSFTDSSISKKEAAEEELYRKYAERKNNRYSERNWKQLGQRLRDMYQINKEIYDAYRRQKIIQPRYAIPPVLFHLDEQQLRMTIDPNIMVQLDSLQNNEVMVKIKDLEKEKLILWDENVYDELSEVQKLLKEIKKTESFFKSDSFKNMVKNQTFLSLKFLKDLHKIQGKYQQAKIDSLERAIEQFEKQLEQKLQKIK